MTGWVKSHLGLVWFGFFFFFFTNHSRRLNCLVRTVRRERGIPARGDRNLGGREEYPGTRNVGLRCESAATTRYVNTVVGGDETETKKEPGDPQKNLNFLLRHTR